MQYGLWYDPIIDHWAVCFPDGENKRQIADRMTSTLNQILNSPYENIGIASHGGSIRYFLLSIGKTLGKMPNTALFHVKYENGKWNFIESL